MSKKFIVNSAKPKLSPVQEWILARMQEHEECEPVQSMREDCPNYRLCDTAKSMCWGMLCYKCGLKSWEAHQILDDVSTLYDWYRIRREWMPSDATASDK